jgi:hypothetical protein
MKLQVQFHMWKDKDFTWHYKLQSEISHVRERISHEITNYNEISHVKGFHMKLQAVAAPGLKNWGAGGGGGFEGQTDIFFGGGKIELLNR